jgi:hypothetical protein
VALERAGIGQSLSFERTMQVVLEASDGFGLLFSPLFTERTKGLPLFPAICAFERRRGLFHHLPGPALTRRILVQAVDSMERAVLDTNIAVDAVNGRLEPFVTVYCHNLQPMTTNASLSDISQ